MRNTLEIAYIHRENAW